MKKDNKKKEMKVPVKQPGVSIDWSKYPSHIKVINHPNFYFDSDKFIFKNGDVYEGEYCAHICGLIWREGKGVYKTKDGHIYKGTWVNDQLLGNAITVKYPDGVRYQGRIEYGKYSGFGIYIPRKNFSVSCKFQGNKPIGEVTLKDSFNNMWRGLTKGHDEIYLFPENHFYTALSYTCGLGKKPKHVNNWKKESVSPFIMGNSLPAASVVISKDYVYISGDQEKSKTSNAPLNSTDQIQFLMHNKTCTQYPKLDVELYQQKNLYQDSTTRVNLGNILKVPKNAIRIPRATVVIPSNVSKKRKTTTKSIILNSKATEGQFNKVWKSTERSNEITSHAESSINYQQFHAQNTAKIAKNKEFHVMQMLETFWDKKYLNSISPINVIPSSPSHENAFLNKSDDNSY